MKILNIYTDGACSGNQNASNIGGWGAILEYGTHKKELYGGEFNTTNNRMEMTAMLEALKAIKVENQTIRVFSDSSYLMECFRQKWYLKWQKNGWKTSAKTDVENKDLWMELISFLPRHKIAFFRVKGHVVLEKNGTDVKKLYNKFVEWNGKNFSEEEFIYITKMNIRADELANMWKNNQEK